MSGYTLEETPIKEAFPEPKHTSFKRREVIKKIKDSLDPAIVKEHSNHVGHYSMIHGKFQVFKILHGEDIILVIDCDRCDQLDLQAVRLEGKRGNAVVRIRNIGTVEGFVRSDAQVYRMDDYCLGIRRVNGNCKDTKEKL